MKTLNLVFLVAFLLSALVQFNDPDPLGWVLIYLAMTVICGLHHFNRLYWGIAALQSLVSILWMLTLLPALAENVSWQEVFGSLAMLNDSVEEVREIGGLLFILIWSITLWRVKHSKTREMTSS